MSDHSDDRRCIVTPEEIRDRAHQLWEAADRPWGREEEFWIEAEDRLLRERIAAD